MHPMHPTAVQLASPLTACFHAEFAGVEWSLNGMLMGLSDFFISQNHDMTAQRLKLGDAPQFKCKAIYGNFNPENCDSPADVGVPFLRQNHIYIYMTSRPKYRNGILGS